MFVLTPGSCQDTWSQPVDDYFSYKPCCIFLLNRTRKRINYRIIQGWRAKDRAWRWRQTTGQKAPPSPKQHCRPSRWETANLTTARQTSKVQFRFPTIHEGLETAWSGVRSLIEISEREFLTLCFRDTAHCCQADVLLALGSLRYKSHFRSLKRERGINLSVIHVHRLTFTSFPGISRPAYNKTFTVASRPMTSLAAVSW